MKARSCDTQRRRTPTAEPLPISTQARFGNELFLIWLRQPALETWPPALCNPDGKTVGAWAFGSKFLIFGACSAIGRVGFKQSKFFLEASN
mmetsp:Transcript_37395/g.58079  ORF Transcript_37395/g.58079 Transcript_37395/m.58079 type:complete len:91 (-) Transcript_37395:297-569(-)